MEKADADRIVQLLEKVQADVGYLKTDVGDLKTDVGILKSEVAGIKDTVSSQERQLADVYTLVTRVAERYGIYTRNE